MNESMIYSLIIHCIVLVIIHAMPRKILTIILTLKFIHYAKRLIVRGRGPM